MSNRCTLFPRKGYREEQERALPKSYFLDVLETARSALAEAFIMKMLKTLGLSRELKKTPAPEPVPEGSASYRTSYEPNYNRFERDVLSAAEKGPETFFYRNQKAA